MIKLSLYASYYGDNNLMRSFRNNDVKIQIEFDSDLDTYKKLLTIDEVLYLQRRIKEILKEYDRYTKYLKPEDTTETAPEAPGSP